MARVRADLLLLARGFTESRARARAAIEAGGVVAGGAPVTHAAQLVEETAEISFTDAHPWVSRAGMKLAHALAHFRVSVDGKVCLDIGASTGGFTQVLLASGARHVTAVDVGRGQFHASLAGDPRVGSLEGQDARALTRDLLREPPGVIVCDASFIGLEKILPIPLSLAAEACDLLALVKPQYEGGPGSRNSVLPPARAFLLAEQVAHRLDGREGFRVQGLANSPVRGGGGSPEYLLHARKDPGLRRGPEGEDSPGGEGQ